MLAERVQLNKLAIFAVPAHWRADYHHGLTPGDSRGNATLKDGGGGE